MHAFRFNILKERVYGYRTQEGRQTCRLMLIEKHFFQLPPNYKETSKTAVLNEIRIRNVQTTTVVTTFKHKAMLVYPFVLTKGCFCEEQLSFLLYSNYTEVIKLKKILNK